MKKKKIIINTLIAVIIICSFNLITRSFRSGTADIFVPEGSSSADIAHILKKNGLITSSTYFLGRLYFSEYRGKLRYGNFTIDKNSYVGDILKKLSTDGAKKSTVTVTIPEGFSVEMIKDRICKEGLCSEDEFESALKLDYDYDFLKSIPDSDDVKYKLQGYLYPSTYEFYTDTDAKTVIDTMLGEFQKQVNDAKISYDNLYDTVTIASMIEREVTVESEMRTVSGVIQNRIKKYMPLQIDATVVYAVTDGKYDITKVLYKDLEVKSKYNTYKNKGLPPGPICSPSIEAIKAAASPESHNYLYYHTDKDKSDGSHIFTETFDEHVSTNK